MIHGNPHAETLKRRTVREGDCIVWTGATDPGGYGCIRVEGTLKKAHRYAWELVNGPIPEGARLDHRCWNKRCVNVSHLRLATASQNAAYIQGGSPSSATGVRNVYQARDKFRVVIKHQRQNLTFGHYSTVEEAARVAERERLRLFGEFAGLG